MIPAPEHFYCISHAPCAWPLPPFMTVIGTGDYRPEGGIAMADRFPHLAHRNAYLGEYVALFAIREMLLESNAQGFVGVCHYRRFALTKPIGQQCYFNFHAHPDLLADVPPESFYHDGVTPIIPMLVGFKGNLIQQYGADNKVRDLLKFFGDAIDLGIITDEESALRSPDHPMARWPDEAVFRAILRRKCCSNCASKITLSSTRSLSSSHPD
jgi:hypothetical protein